MGRDLLLTRAILSVTLGSSIVFLLTLIFNPEQPNSDDPQFTSLETTQNDDGDEVKKLKLRLDDMQASLTQAVARIEELSCIMRNTGTRGEYCLRKDTLESGGYTAWDWKLAIHLEGLLAEQSVAEFGAGLGWYGRFFLRIPHPLLKGGNETEMKYFFNNTDVMKMMEIPQLIHSWKGYDRATFVEQFTGGLVQFLDLGYPFWLPEKFDWVLTFDVGERIPSHLEDNFIDNLVRHACKGIVLSWGVPDETLPRHVNKRSTTYITEKMEQRGFEPDVDWEEQLQGATTLSWMQYSLMVFRPVEPIEDEACNVVKTIARIPWEEFLKKWEEERKQHPEEANEEVENATMFLSF